jgi:hypothetical protein
MNTHQQHQQVENTSPMVAVPAYWFGMLCRQAQLCQRPVLDDQEHVPMYYMMLCCRMLCDMCNKLQM